MIKMKHCPMPMQTCSANMVDFINSHRGPTDAADVLIPSTSSTAGPRLPGWVNPFNIKLVGTWSCCRSCSGARLPPDKLSTLVCFRLLWASDPAKMGADFWLPVSIRFSLTRSFSCSYLHGCCHFCSVHGGSPAALDIPSAECKPHSSCFLSWNWFFFFRLDMSTSCCYMQAEVEKSALEWFQRVCDRRGQ